MPTFANLCRALPILFLVACAAPDAPAPAPPTPDFVRALLEVRAPSAPVLGARGELYVRDWPDGVNQVWRIEPDGTRARLTAFADGANAFAVSPDGSRMLITAADGGNEEDQVWALTIARNALATSAPEALLERRRTVFRPQAWLHDSSGFVYAANDVSSHDFHLYRFDFDAPGSTSGSITKLSDRPGSWSLQDLTRDGARVLATRYVSESEAYAFELRGGAIERELRPPLAHTRNVGAIGYLPDEEHALVETDWPDGTRRVWVASLSTEEFREALPSLHAKELDDSRLAFARDFLAVVVNDQGYGELHVFRLPSFEAVPLPTIERGLVRVSDLRAGKLLFTLENARTPGLAFELALPPSGTATLRQITQAESRGVDLADLVPPQLVSYRSFDGLEVPAFLYVPPARRAGERIPFVVHFHGGPEGQHRPGFDRTVQALVARGFGVLQPNVRGSTGYGRAYHQMDDREKRWASVRDGVAAAHWLVERGYSDAGRIAAYGGSYGGFMTVATVIEGGALFGAGIDVVGIVNFETFLEQTADYRRALREAEYGALDDRAFLRSISPLHRADEIACPMLIAHGLNDPRVPVGEAMQLALALQRRGLEPEQVYFTDEGHGFQKLENRAHFLARMVRFLDRTIGR